MLLAIVVVIYLAGIIQSSQGSAAKSRCAVVIFVNQSSFNSEADFSEYVENIRGLSSNRSSVYFSENPDVFKVKHGSFIDAPGLFALESQKYPGLFLRRANHTMTLEAVQSNEDFKDDATFLMDHAEKNETYTTLKLFSHRSWKLSSPVDIDSPLLFEDYKENMQAPLPTSELLVVAQPCPQEKSNVYQVASSPKARPNTETKRLESGSEPSTNHVSRDVTVKPPPASTDATLNLNPDTKYLTAITDGGSLKSIPNEYSFDDFEVPNFIVNSLVENAKTASDGVETPKPEAKPVTVVENNTPQQPVIAEHTNKVPITKQKITDLSSLTSLLDEPSDLDDIENNLKDLQYGSKGCKLLVAEDTMEEDAASKDTVAHPQKNKTCTDEFPEACTEMARKGYCLAFKSLMSSVCKKSCNVCSRMLDTGFTSCTKSCGGGKQMRMIKINRREYLQTRRCNIKSCPINGGYSAFGPYTECSVTCGEGVMFRRRTCTNPRPQYKGKSCRVLGAPIESKPCHTGPCPQEHETPKVNKEKTQSSRHLHKATLHIDGPHSDKVHQHSILLQGRKVAKLRCTPRTETLRNMIQDSPTKRFIVHPVKKDVRKSKKSNVEEHEVVYNHEGLPVDTAKTVVKAFKSPYKIILARKGRNHMKLLEECVEIEEKLNEEDDISKLAENPTFEKHEENLVYTKPEEKSYSDFDEYKYESGNIVTPQVTTSHDDDDHDYTPPTGKFFGEAKPLDLLLNKMNSISSRVSDQVKDEENLESSFKMDNTHPVEAFTFNGPEGEGGSEMGDETDTDKDNYGYKVVTEPDR